MKSFDGPKKNNTDNTLEIDVLKKAIKYALEPKVEKAIECGYYGKNFSFWKSMTKESDWFAHLAGLDDSKKYDAELVSSKFDLVLDNAVEELIEKCKNEKF